MTDEKSALARLLSDKGTDLDVWLDKFMAWLNTHNPVTPHGPTSPPKQTLPEHVDKLKVQ